MVVSNESSYQLSDILIFTIIY